ncbi:excisionase [Staphylococcus pseudoxylosus]|uniref:excisionase n=1 Tax=Staphylococcus pseudoxylosus TaxID=2282419 RepID=UPI00298F8E8E|nr:excisionase [Staphylococcus pseudoxylosus]
MTIKFNAEEIAYIKESIENYSNEFDIYDDEQGIKRKLYENISYKIESEYKDSYLFKIIN